MFKKIILIVLVIIIIAIFYFSWIADPSLRSETYLPKWLVDESNEYYNLRTAVPFLVVGFLLETYTKYMGSNGFKNTKNSTFMQNLGIATIIVFLAEGGQFFIQTRSPDVMDVYFGIIGSLVGAVLYNLFSMLMNSKRYRDAK